MSVVAVCMCSSVSSFVVVLLYKFACCVQIEGGERVVVYIVGSRWKWIREGRNWGNQRRIFTFFYFYFFSSLLAAARSIAKARSATRNLWSSVAPALSYRGLCRNRYSPSQRIGSIGSTASDPPYFVVGSRGGLEQGLGLGLAATIA